MTDCKRIRLRTAIALIAASILAGAGCAGSGVAAVPPTLTPAATGSGTPAPPSIAAPVRETIDSLKAYEAQVGFEATRNFAAASGEAFPGRCYFTGILELPDSYRQLQLSPAVNGKCGIDETKYDVFPYLLEVAATGRSPVTPALEGAALERLLMVVPHEDFHNQPEMNRAPPAVAEAAATLVGYLAAAGFARQRYGPDSPVYQRLALEATLFLAKARIVNDYFEKLSAAYGSYRGGRIGRDEALASKRTLFGDLLQACSSSGPAPASFNRCPAIMNNAGLAFDRTYTREYPMLFDLHVRLGGDVASTVTALRRLLARWPPAAKDGSDLIEALQKGP